MRRFQDCEVPGTQKADMEIHQAQSHFPRVQCAGAEHWTDSTAQVKNAWILPRTGKQLARPPSFLSIQTETISVIKTLPYL